MLQPLILLVMLIMLPAVWGMYQGKRRSAISLRYAIAWVVAVAALTALPD
jgi:hypothetical protein